MVGFSTCPSKWQAFKLATLSGFAEPLGVIIVGMSSDTRTLEIYIFFFTIVIGKCGFRIGRMEATIPNEILKFLGILICLEVE